MAPLFNIKAWIEKYPILRLGFWSLFVTNAGSALNFLTQILLVRNLPAGQLADFNSIMSLTMVGYSYLILIPLMVTQGVIQLKNKGTKAAVFIRDTFLICLLPYMAISIGIVFWKTTVLEGFKIQNSALLMLALGFPLMYTLNNIVVGILQGYERYSQLLLWQFLQPLLLAVLTLVFVKICVWGSFGAIVASGTAYLICLSYFSFRTIALFPHLFKYGKANGENILDSARSVLKMILPIALFSFITVLIGNADILLVKRAFDPHTAGSYVAIASLARISIMVTAPFVAFLFPKIMSNIGTGAGSLGVILQAFLLTVAVSGTLCIFLALFPETVIAILYGKAYAEAAIYLPELSLNMAILSCLNILFTAVLAKRQYGFLYFSLAFLIAGNTCLYLFFDRQIHEFIRVMTVLNAGLTLGNLLLLFISYRRQKG